ncbi:MAG: flagellar protein FlaG [Gammaproteobacteria bacterium]|nr:flagellar protein FlaG [Gammaproteobacteria bacterium]
MEAKVSALPSTDVMRVAAAEGTAALEKLARDDAVARVKSVRDNQRQQQSIDALREDFRESVSDANERLIQQGRAINISVDRETNIVVVSVSDRESGEKIRQIPPEEALNVTRNIDRLTGILVDKKV